jgi:hypothetical protein
MKGKAQAPVVARGRGEFAPPKPGGSCLAMKHFPDLREATPAARQEYYRYKRMIVSVSVL